MGEIIRQRDKTLQSTDAEDATDDQENEKRKVQRNRWGTLKYYFNRFRYYHYWLAEKVDTLIGILCLTVIKIYFFLMDWDKRLASQEDEPTNIMSMDDE